MAYQRGPNLGSGGCSRHHRRVGKSEKAQDMIVVGEELFRRGH